ncbi:transcription factor bHLH153 isoform X3 [Prosopis cineraria]|uniref:transcription factor bHLH153 isoform X3 n=1 Tax=Prosopis cineraria TaxID=364024 RepID=UPI00240FB7B6|nr:transcription factor bHLH153 isoform X3 [Prosopis cineraria]
MTASSFCNADSVFSREEGVDIRKMMEPKRSFCSVDQSNYTSIASKRQKADLSISTKSDTASVLLEATHYIRFLHKQVKVLSAPYLQCSPTTKTQDIGIGAYSLRSRGLCLVPVSYTIGVAQSNGADIWAPTKSTPSQFA